MVQGKVIDEETREIIFQVYLYFANEASRFRGGANKNYFNKVQARVAEATGVSPRSLYNLLKSQDMVRFQATLQKPGKQTTKSKKRQSVDASDSKEDSDTEEYDPEQPGPSKTTRRTRVTRATVHKVTKCNPPPLVPLPTHVKPDPDSAQATTSSMEIDPKLIKTENSSDSDDE